jgi:hypothetical protein
MDTPEDRERERAEIEGGGRTRGRGTRPVRCYHIFMQESYVGHDPCSLASVYANQSVHSRWKATSVSQCRAGERGTFSLWPTKSCTISKGSSGRLQSKKIN